MDLCSTTVLLSAWPAPSLGTWLRFLAPSPAQLCSPGWTWRRDVPSMPYQPGHHLQPPAHLPWWGSQPWHLVSWKAKSLRKISTLWVNSSLDTMKKLKLADHQSPQKLWKAGTSPQNSVRSAQSTLPQPTQLWKSRWDMSCPLSTTVETQVHLNITASWMPWLQSTVDSVLTSG